MHVQARMHYETQPTRPRKLLLIDKPGCAHWGCSTCAWTFRISDRPVGNSFAEMTSHLQTQLDEAFAAHDCAKYHLGTGCEIGVS
jgi:hypothetical protein